MSTFKCKMCGGIGASSSNIINYCKDNWSSSIWDFNGSTPKFK